MEGNGEHHIASTTRPLSAQVSCEFMGEVAASIISEGSSRADPRASQAEGHLYTASAGKEVRLDPSRSPMPAALPAAQRISGPTAGTFHFQDASHNRTGNYLPQHVLHEDQSLSCQTEQNVSHSSMASPAGAMTPSSRDGAISFTSVALPPWTTSWLTTWLTIYPTTLPSGSCLTALATLTQLSEVDVLAWLRRFARPEEDNLSHARQSNLIPPDDLAPSLMPRLTPQGLGSRGTHGMS
jgi:hypothetical protein